MNLLPKYIAALAFTTAPLWAFAQSTQHNPDGSAARDAWQGPYVALFASHTTGTINTQGYGDNPGTGGPGCVPYSSLDADCLDQPEQTSSAVSPGIAVGYNVRYGRTIFGIEADWQSTQLDSSSGLHWYTGGVYTPEPDHLAETHIHAFATLRLRAGYLLTDKLMVYGTGGVAVVQATARFQDEPLGTPNITAQYDQLAWGWATGVGLEYQINRNWHIKAEYLQVNVNDAALSAGANDGEWETYTFRSNMNIRMGRIGLVYQF